MLHQELVSSVGKTLLSILLISILFFNLIFLANYLQSGRYTNFIQNLEYEKQKLLEQRVLHSSELDKLFQHQRRLSQLQNDFSSAQSNYLVWKHEKTLQEKMSTFKTLHRKEIGRTLLTGPITTISKPNLLFIGMLKGASTSMQQVITNIAQEIGFNNLPRLKNDMMIQVETCFGEKTTLANFNKLLKQTSPEEGKFQILHARTCFRKELMTNGQYWSTGKRPFVLTLMRHPLAHFRSNYRLHAWCCTEQRPFCRTAGLCPTDHSFLSFEQFLNTSYNCQKRRDCSPQSFLHFRGDMKQEADLVLIAERFEESLAILGVKLGLSLQALFSPFPLKVSADPLEYVQMTDKVETRFRQVELKTDFETYDWANARLDKFIQELDSNQRIRFDILVEKLIAGNQYIRRKCLNELEGKIHDDYFNLCQKNHACWMGVEQGW